MSSAVALSSTIHFSIKQTDSECSTQNHIVATQFQRERLNTAFFKIITVKMHDPNATIDACAFLDVGSGLTLMDQEILDRLNIMSSLSDGGMYNMPNH